MKWLIGAGLLGVGFVAGVEFTKWYAKQRVTETGDQVISKVFGSGYLGSIATGVFHGALDQAVN